MQLHIRSVFPQPPTDVSLSSPHQPAEILPKYAHLEFIFLPPSPSLFPPLVPLSLSSSLHPSAERQLRQTGILDKPVWGRGFWFLAEVPSWSRSPRVTVLFSSLLSCWSAESCCFCPIRLNYTAGIHQGDRQVCCSVRVHACVCALQH